MIEQTLTPITPENDPWEAYDDMKRFAQLQLTNVEFTTSTICNMRCEHCAVGYILQTKDPEPLPLDLLIRRLDEVEHLRAFSITGGEPMLSMRSIDEYVAPLLRYAHERGARTQLNSNLTLELSRYEKIIPYLDVLHISYNYHSVDDFCDIAFSMMERKPSRKVQEGYLERIIENTKQLASAGVFVSAETMINKRTLPHLEAIHEQIVQLGCKRHEVHPMYPSDFASQLEVATLDDIRNGIERLLNARNQDVWMLFGTLPFYACSDNDTDLALLQRLSKEKNVTVRNDPDGRSRLNVNIFTGEIIVTDFGDAPPLGNVKETTLQQAFSHWLNSPLAKQLNCHCPSVQCLGPNVLVKNAYYNDVDFSKKQARLS